MKYACIGEHLKHSFSKVIHNALADYEYEIKEIPKTELDSFMKRADFLCINVTIPYKEAEIPYLFEIDSAAKSIGAVNTIVNKNGKLFGYNTDFYGMCELFEYARLSAAGKKAVILGSAVLQRPQKPFSSISALLKFLRYQGLKRIAQSATRSFMKSTLMRKLSLTQLPLECSPKPTQSPSSFQNFQSFRELLMQFTTH